MLAEVKKKPGINEFSEELKEASILKHFSKPKPPTQTMMRTDFLYCDPPEVILQSNFYNVTHSYNRHRKEQNV
jgi:site-specific DNA-adenine methylase